MPNPVMSTLQQAELQRSTFDLVERFRQKHALAAAAVFDFLVCFAWGYARRQGEPNEVIANRMREHCDRCELAYQKATAPRLGDS